MKYITGYVFERWFLKESERESERESESEIESKTEKEIESVMIAKLRE